MAAVSVRLRNSTNTATNPSVSLEPARDVEYVVEKNKKGRGSFKLKNDDPAAAVVTSGSIVRFTLAGTGRFVARVKPRGVSKVSVGDEGHEEIEYECDGVLVDWEDDVVRPSAIQCDFVPSLDERYFNIFSGEHEPDGSWENATEIALQGWGSAFYTGQPASWTDPAARFIWSSAGTDSNAPPGRCIFKESILVNAGKKVIEWGADNYGILYLNGKKINDGSDFRKKQSYEFETTAGFLTIAFDVTNAEDDGPPGGNPGAVIGSLREDGPEGPVVWRTTNTMKVLPYPASIPGIPVGEIIRKCMEGATVDSTWTVIGLDDDDYLGNPWPTIEDISFRFYTDTLYSVLETLAEIYLDFKVGFGDGLELYLYNKGTAGDVPATLNLVAGYADEATDANTNITELDWEVEPPKYTAVALRWSDSWVVRGSGNPIVGVRAEQIKTNADAVAVADALLDLYSNEQRTASFEYLALDEPDDLPFIAFNIFDEIEVPGDGDLDVKIAQDVYSIAVKGVNETDEAEYIVTVGDPILDEIELLEAAIKRGAPGLGGSQGRVGSPTSGSQRPSGYGRYYASGIGAPGIVVASMPNVPEGATEEAPATFVGQVPALRLYGTDPTGTSTVHVFDGTSTHVLSGGGSGLIDYLELSGVSWDTTTMVTVTVVTKGHRSLHVVADLAEVSA